VSQTIPYDILMRKRQQFSLQFNAHKTRLGKAAGQKQNHNSASGAQIEHRRVSVIYRQDKIGQEKGIEGKPIAMPRLLQRQLPGTRHIRG
jgi:hypothetical protein